MTICLDALRTDLKISSLCQVIEVTLTPCKEEGFSRHFLHFLPTPLVVERKGSCLANPCAAIAVLFELRRHTPLPLLLEDKQPFPHRAPFESLLLAMPAGDPVIPQRTRLMEEASRLFLELAEARERAVAVVVSHRRLVHNRMVIRHQPAALLALDGAPLWLHPAARGYGLIQAPFPSGQKNRHLGPRQRGNFMTERMLYLDHNGMPEWYLQAKELLKDEGEDEPLLGAILDFQAESLLQRSVEADAEAALQQATQDFLTGFETFFGMGGLMPQPGVI